MKKTTAFKRLIMDKDILVLPGAHDAITAKITEETGFKAIALGGYPATASILGKPDISLLTLTEMVHYTKNIVEAVNIPVFTDADTGYGGVPNVIRTVREFEKTGVAGMFIEDQLFPKRCGHMEGKQVIPTEDMIAKIKAAVDTREDPDFIIMARTDALAVLGIEQAIERSNRYRQAGADLIFVEAPRTQEDMLKINGEIEAPTMAIQIEGGRTPLMTVKELEQIGYNVVVYPVSTLYAASWAVKQLMEELMGHGTTRLFMDKMITFNDFNELVGLPQLREKESSYYHGES